MRSDRADTAKWEKRINRKANETAFTKNNGKKIDHFFQITLGAWTKKGLVLCHSRGTRCL